MENQYRGKLVKGHTNKGKNKGNGKPGNEEASKGETSEREKQ